MKFQGCWHWIYACSCDKTNVHLFDNLPAEVSENTKIKYILMSYPYVLLQIAGFNVHSHVTSLFPILALERPPYYKKNAFY